MNLPSQIGMPEAVYFAEKAITEAIIEAFQAIINITPAPKSREKIKKALESLGVVHGHTHDNNFIVYFDRDEQGEPILDKPPRVYVIDFDQAVSLGK